MRLLEFEPLMSARLDKINEALIESYVQERRKQVAPATVNRDLSNVAAPAEARLRVAVNKPRS
jgi:hypothetical protein